MKKIITVILATFSLAQCLTAHALYIEDMRSATLMQDLPLKVRSCAIPFGPDYLNACSRVPRPFSTILTVDTENQGIYGMQLSQGADIYINVAAGPDSEPYSGSNLICMNIKMPPDGYLYIGVDSANNYCCAAYDRSDNLFGPPYNTNCSGKIKNLVPSARVKSK